MTSFIERPSATSSALSEGSLFGRGDPSGLLTLPHLDAKPALALALPPIGYLPAGEVSDAWLRGDPFVNQPKRRPSAAQATGLRYEKKVAAKVREVVGDAADVLVAPWIGFKTNALTRVCQPDVVILGNRALCVVESKYAFTSQAYWQLVHLYRPVCAALWRGREVSLCVVTRSFDPDIVVPCPVTLFHEGPGCLSKPLPTFNSKQPTLNVILWKP